MGQRPRTVYTITARAGAPGRLGADSGAGPSSSSSTGQGVLAEHATRQDLLATIAGAQSGAALECPRGSRRLLDGSGPFPERLPWLLLVGSSCSTSSSRRAWADSAHEIVESWPDDLSAAEPDWTTLQNMAASPTHTTTTLTRRR